MTHRSTAELEQGLDHIRQSPADSGTLELIVRRPAVGEREVLEVASLTTEDGLAGDSWSIRPSNRTSDGSPHPEMQVNIMNARAAMLLAVDPDRRQLAGDQLYIDLDIGGENLPAGTQLAIGEAVLEVTAEPHTGCKKFADRFGDEAWRFVNSPVGRELNLRGINARVVSPGSIAQGDRVLKLEQ